MKILFICQGNVGRSQMAEAFYNHLTKSKNAISAGISKTTPKVYGNLPKEIRDLMMEEGIDVSKNKVETVTKDILKNAEKIFILRTNEQFPKHILNSKKAVTWRIEDPYEMSLDGIRRIRDQIKERVLGII